MATASQQGKRRRCGKVKRKEVVGKERTMYSVDGVGNNRQSQEVPRGRRSVEGGASFGAVGDKGGQGSAAAGGFIGNGAGATPRKTPGPSLAKPAPERI